MRAAVHAVQIRNHRVPLTQSRRRRLLRRIAVSPRLLAHKRVRRGMQPHDGGVLSELHPAGIQLVATDAEHVAADVVAPPGVADVGRVRREIRLEIEALPGDHCVARKTERIAVRACLRVAREDQRPLAVAPGIQRMVVVECPERVEPGNGGGLFLLPVDPPEIDARVLIRLVQNIEISFGEPRIGNIKFDGLLALGVQSDRACHFRILILERTDALRRVKVDRDLEVHLLQLTQHGFVVRKQLCVPAVARPAQTAHDVADRLAGGTAEPEVLSGKPVADVDPVPVHVDRRDGQRNLCVAKARHQIEVFLLRVRLVAAPPVAETPARDERRLAAKPVEIAQTAAVVVAVGEVIDVFERPFAREDRPVVGDQTAFSVVKYADAAAAHQSVFETVGAVGTVQRPVCALEVARFEIGHFFAALERHGNERALAKVKAEDAVCGADSQLVAAFFERKARTLKIAEPDLLRRRVAEFAALRRFEPDKAGRQHAETHLPAYDHTARVGFRRAGNRKQITESCISICHHQSPFSKVFDTLR